MCCCDKPNVNGTPGYKWQPRDEPSVRQPHPPELAEGDTLLYDEPGRCGGLDGHCHHFRLVKPQYGDITLLVQHGGGSERIALDCVARVAWAAGAFAALNSDQRYWMLYAMHSIHGDASRSMRDKISSEWAKAFLDKRIKKQKRQGRVRVWIEQPAIATPAPSEPPAEGLAL